MWLQTIPDYVFKVKCPFIIASDLHAKAFSDVQVRGAKLNPIYGFKSIPEIKIYNNEAREWSSQQVNSFEQLTAPEVSIQNNILSISETNDSTSSFIVLVDGKEKAVVSSNTVSILEKLSSPTIVVDSDILQVATEDLNTRYFIILIDGVQKAIMEAQ